METCASLSMDSGSEFSSNIYGNGQGQVRDSVHHALEFLLQCEGISRNPGLRVSIMRSSFRMREERM